MKKINALFAGLLLTVSICFTQQANAQAPQHMSYQSVIRNSSNALVAATPVGMQISLLQGTASGTAVYVETQTATTNANGLVSIEIGTGTSTTGTFSEIDWATGPYFIKTEIDPAGGSNYTITGTQQMASVPYALYAKTSGNGQGPAGPQGIQGPAGEDGTNGLDGINGLSAYQVWIGLGNTGTETDFINSLTGPQGAPGATGSQGAQGIQGVAGTTGAVGAAGPEGPQGATGPAGVSGLTGAQGPQGIQGPAGADGQGGVSTAGSGINVTGAGTVASPYVVSTTSPCGLAIGQTYQGGIIFYLDASGCHGLIAAPSDQSASSAWWNGDYLDTRAYGSGLFEGKYNTRMINWIQGGASSAAAICRNLTLGGYSDWYLPSIEELNKMYQNIGQGNIGGFSYGYYWSSTGGDYYSAWQQLFFDGFQRITTITSESHVRAVRAF